MRTITLSQSAEQIAQGKIGVIPTDTVYGLCASAVNEVAVKSMYKLKARENKPGTLIAANIDHLVDMGIKRRYLKPVEHYWPGPISVVTPTGFILEYLHQGKHSLAIRIPKDNKLQKLLEKTGPIITTSANLPGKPPAQTTDQAVNYFGEDVDFYVDGGVLQRESSTIIRIVDDAVEVLREGSVKIDEETGRILS